MYPESYPKPELTPERAEKLGNDGFRMKRALEARRRWLVSERKKASSSEHIAAIDNEISKIAHVLADLHAREQEFTEDDAVRFLHDAARILGLNDYSGTADVLPFKPREK